MTRQARACEVVDAQGTASARSFAGLTPEIEFFIERTAPIEPAALDRWKALEGEGWDVTALVDEQAKTMVGLGWRYRPALEASA